MSSNLLESTSSETSRVSSTRSSITSPITLTSTRNPFIDEANVQVSTDYASIKTSWTLKKLSERQNEFLDDRQVSLFAVTWNVNGVGGESVDLGPLFLSSCQSPPDLVFISLQEVDRRAEAYVWGGGGVIREESWNLQIKTGLATVFPHRTYRRVCSKLLVGIYAGVFVAEGSLIDKDWQQRYLSKDPVTMASAACGLMGVMGNKGGVGVRIRLFDQHVCLVSSHLAAHMADVQRRNEDFQEISTRLVFPRTIPPAVGGTLEWIERWIEEDSIDWLKSVTAGPARLFDCRVLVWAGDLNYRISLDSLKVRSFVLMEQYERLYDLDQLRAEMAAGRAFFGFNEAPITFPPTYKYDPGTGDFDSSPKMRAPAWTDRILWRVAKDNPEKESPVKVLSYGSVPGMQYSDHRPVYVNFEISLGKVDPDRFERVLQDLFHEMDDLENASIPVTMVSNNLIDFGPVRFAVTYHRTIELVNCGLTVANFSFLSSSDHQWVMVSPERGSVAPGHSRHILFTHLTDAQLVREQRKGGTDHLEDILILHIDRGRDHFISVSARLLPTVFAYSLATTCVPAVQTEGDSTELLRKIPPVLWRIVDFLYRNGHSDLFFTDEQAIQLLLLKQRMRAVEPFASTWEAIIGCIDEGRDLPEAIANSEQGVRAMALALLVFLQSLEYPVISSFKEDFPLSNSDAFKGFIDRMPSSHFTVLQYLMAFIRDCLLNDSLNNVKKLEGILQVFARVLFQPNDHLPDSEMSARVQFLKKLL